MVPFAAFKWQPPKDQLIKRMKDDSFSSNIQECLQRGKTFSINEHKIYGGLLQTITDYYQKTRREGLINRNKLRKGID